MHGRPGGARGSGALSGFADIVMEMSCLRRARSRDRRRRICAYSRYVETPRHLIVELNADGSDYVVRTDAAGTPLAQPWPELLHILGRASDKLTQQTILERWPVEGEAPDRATLSRWLKRASKQGVICCSGSGYRGDPHPFVYWLPGRDPLLWPRDNAIKSDKQGGTAAPAASQTARAASGTLIGRCYRELTLKGSTSRKPPADSLRRPWLGRANGGGVTASRDRRPAAPGRQGSQ
jgi:hypothetical protein